MKYDLVISGTIGGWGTSADYVRYVLSNNRNKEVHVGFCSLGGLVKDGLEMNQAFADHGNVHAHAFGMNASISTIAMLGCKTIDIVKGSFFLIHNVSTWINKYEQANKEQIDVMIKDLKNQKDSLKTFDEVLASMYAEKTGKDIDTCLNQMKKGNWLTAQQSVDFGLVDKIREDKQAEQAADEFSNQFVNSYSNNNILKDAGIPPLIETAIVDLNGEPTQSFLQKTWQGLQALIHQNHAIIKINMIFKNVMDIINSKELNKDASGNILLTENQMQSIEDSIEALRKKDVENAAAIKAGIEAVKKAKDDLNSANENIKLKDEKITALEKSAGDTTDDPEKHKAQEFTAQDLYNAIKDA